MKHPYKLTQKTKKIMAVVAILLVLAVSVWLILAIGKPMIQFASQPEVFRDWMQAHGIGGKLAYMSMVLLQVLVAVIPGEPLEIVGGYAFGAVEGTILCLVASTVGSLLVFWLVRLFGVPMVELFFPREKLEKFRFLKASKKRDFWFMVIFMLPGTPKDVLCYFAGLTDIRFSVWLMICSFGRIPSVITSTVGGDMLGSRQYLFAAAVFVITMVVSLGGLWLYQHICKKKND